MAGRQSIRERGQSATGTRRQCASETHQITSMVMRKLVMGENGCEGAGVEAMTASSAEAAVLEASRAARLDVALVATVVALLVRGLGNDGLLGGEARGSASATLLEAVSEVLLDADGIDDVVGEVIVDERVPDALHFSLDIAVVGFDFEAILFFVT